MKFISSVKNKLYINRKYFVRKFTTIMSCEFSLISAFLLFVSLENDCGIVLKGFCQKCLPLIIATGLAVIIAAIKTCTFHKVKIIDETQRTIELQYGDLWKCAFPRFCHEERVVVVNVNTAFDVIVDPPGVDKPLVSATTLHGQWIKQMQKRGITPEKLNQEIQNDLIAQDIQPSHVVEKSRGNTKLYPKGTIARYRYNETTFYLLAFSEFDGKNNAHNTPEELQSTILKLMKFIDCNNQSCNVYIPVMGAGSSRTHIDDQTALDIMAFNLKLNKELLRGNIHVVVYKGNRDKVAIEGGY